MQQWFSLIFNNHNNNIFATQKIVTNHMFLNFKSNVKANILWCFLLSSVCGKKLKGRKTSIIYCFIWNMNSFNSYSHTCFSMRLLGICLEVVRNRPKGQLFLNVPIVDMTNCKAFTHNQCSQLWLKTHFETNWDNTFTLLHK